MIETINEDPSGEKFTAQSLLDFLRLSNDHWYQNDNTKALKVSWVFRGQENAEWKLTPSLWRYSRTQINNILKKIRDVHHLHIPEDYSDGQYIYQQVYASLLHRFAQNADQVNLFRYNNLGVNSLFNDVLTGKCVEIEALAQHHGMPSRLLDWTDNPIYAAYFAALAGDRKRKAGNLCIFALDTSRLFGAPQGLGANVVVIKRPSSSTTSYLGSQRGLFSAIEYHQRSLFSNGHESMERINIWPRASGNATDSWPDLEAELHNRNNFKREPILRKIIINRSESRRLLELLEREGVSRFTMQPSFDVIASELCDQYLPKTQYLPRK